MQSRGNVLFTAKEQDKVSSVCKSYKSNEVLSWSNNHFLINSVLLTSHGVLFSPHPLYLTEHLPFPTHT